MEKIFGLLLCLGVALGAGTPKDIRNIFVSRCNTFQKSNTISDAYGTTWKKRDCGKVADDIISGFKKRDKCGVPGDAFKRAIQSSMQPLLPNKMTLWSGVYKHSKAFAKAMGLYTLETGTMLGFVGDGLTFCGKKTPPGINYDSCPKWGECSGSGKDAVGVYWSSISKALAQMAKGTVRALLNGSMKGGRLPFRDDSVCASIEIPNLNPRLVKKVEVLLIHYPGEPIVEKCATGASIKKMRLMVEKKGIAFGCIDDPKPIHNLLCKETPKAKGC